MYLLYLLLVMGKGFGNPTGILVRVPWVRVRVHIWKPLENPYHCQGSGVTLGICHGFFIYTNLFSLFIVMDVLVMEVGGRCVEVATMVVMQQCW